MIDDDSRTDQIRAEVRNAIGRKNLPDDAAREILRRGAAVVPLLLEALEDRTLWLSDSLGGGWAPVHAIRLLAEMKAPEAVEPMLRALAQTGPLDLLHDRVLQSLPLIGAPVIEPALREYPHATPEVRRSLAAVLSSAGVHDERIFRILLALLKEDPGAAADLAIYGDKRAVPYLHEALDAFELRDEGGPFANQALIEIREALEELGGTLTAEQEAKCLRGRRAADRFRRILLRSVQSTGGTNPAAAPMRRRDRPGRNDPCWCGSGIKYKHCHRDTDERPTLPGSEP